MFDIRSLLLEVPDYRAVFSDLRSNDIYAPPPPAESQGEYGLGTGEAAPAPEPTSRGQEENAEVLMNMIQEIINQDSWRTHGGELGVMHYYGGQLVVSHTPDVVSEVERLLNLLKASRSLKLRLDAWFVTVLSASEPLLMDDVRQRPGLAWDEFHKLLKLRGDEVCVARASVTGFEGQRVYTTVGRQHNVLVGADAVVAAGAAAYVPVSRQLVSGVTLEVQAVLDAAQETVLVDLRASLGQLMPTPVEPGVPADALSVGGSMPPIDPAGVMLQFNAAGLAAGGSVPPYQVAHFATSVSLPVDRVSLVGVARYDDEWDVMLFVMPSRE